MAGEGHQRHRERRDAKAVHLRKQGGKAALFLHVILDVAAHPAAGVNYDVNESIASKRTTMSGTLTREKVLQMLRDEMPRLRERFGVARMALFGSFAKGNATGRSDVDLLVEFCRPVGLEFVSLGDHLERVLGRKVHLTTFATLHQSLLNPRHSAIAEEIVRTATDV